ncbi:MAG: glyoxalase/bleomycin resistance/extradiol dioxygenase family protein [Rhodospirillales bacterium 39-66-50]|nr:MAG: glyoxalase/bleomycin resistance/extradiol dioxygenase family protein [Rhodospirillales bacterium 39-66-50]
MFDHVSIGVADIARTRKFYDAALEPLGYARLSDGETSLGYGEKEVGLWIGKAAKPVKADMESGLHFCFVAGGSDNGKPGLRSDYSPTYYAAFVIDPDGYRIEAYCGK